MMAFVTMNKRNTISLQLACALLFLVSTLLLVAHARDISSSRRVDVVVKRGAAAHGVLQDAEVIGCSDTSSSISSQAYETKHEQENLSRAEGIDVDSLVVDYTPARKKPPIHN